jgi:hypothetical protein
MKSLRLVSLRGLLVAMVAAIACLAPCDGAAQTRAMTFTATNPTMPVNGIGESKFTIQGITLTGTIVLSCKFAGTPANAHAPICPMTPPVAYQVDSGGTLTGTIFFYPYGSAVPAALHQRAHGTVVGAGLAGLSLAGVLLFGLGIKNKPRTRVRSLLLWVCCIGAVAAFTSCGGSTNPGVGGPPGTYPYTVSAVNNASDNGLSVMASTNILVTVP